VRASDDSGFTLVETIVAIGLISTVMAAVTTFMVESLRATDQQRVMQTAIQVADTEVEHVRNIDPASLPTGRVAGLVDTTVSGQIPGLTGHLGDMEQLNVPLAGVTAPLSLTPATVPVNKVTFTTYRFLGRCWQPAEGDDCAGPPGVSGSLVFLRVVVAVTWRANACGNRPCAYITSTLINTISGDPQFNTNDTAQPPLIVNPGSLATDVGVAVTRQLDASGGVKPYTWYSANLPPGLTMGTDGKITGTPTAPGVYLVTVTAKDANQLLGTADLVWTINAPPTLTPVNQRTSVGTPVTMTPLLSGGTGPFEWKANGLPSGLSINKDTGEITGSPSVNDVNKTLTPRITVTDVHKLTAETTFTWQILPALVVTATAAQVSTVGGLVNVTTNSATGGLGPYTWTAKDLPDGLTIEPATGAVRGRPTTVKLYTVVLTVTDTIGSSTSVTVLWTVL
jgi:prepilin-type N-terminal cleavage/methylation domain-containing protein